MSNKKLGRFYGVGVGPGNPKFLTVRAVEIFREVDVIFEVIGKNSASSVSGSVLDSLEGLNTERVRLTFSMSLDESIRQNRICENATVICAELADGKNCAFATIGDPAIYSTCSYIVREIRKNMPSVKIETVPGITSFQAAAAHQNATLCEEKESLCIIPAFAEENLKDYPIESADNLVFLKTYHTRNAIISTLDSMEDDFESLYAVKVGLVGEFVTCDMKKAKSMPDEYLSLLAVRKNAKTEK